MSWVYAQEFKFYRECDKAPIVLLNVIPQAEPRNVMLVHGEAEKMEFLKQKIVKEFGNQLIHGANLLTSVPTQELTASCRLMGKLLPSQRSQKFLSKSPISC